MQNNSNFQSFCFRFDALNDTNSVIPIYASKFSESTPEFSRDDIVIKRETCCEAQGDIDNKWISVELEDVNCLHKTKS